MSTLNIALNRFGLGARPTDAIPNDPQRWLLDQFTQFQVRPESIVRAPTGEKVGSQLFAYHAQQKLRPQQVDAQQMLHSKAAPPRDRASELGNPLLAGSSIEPIAGSVKGEVVKNDVPAGLKSAVHEVRQVYALSVAARTNAALLSETPFVERLVHFWANHFAVSAEKVDLVGLSGNFEFEAIRPHVLGRFVDMLVAVERHPAMLIYLDQAISVGPESVIGKLNKRKKVGLNENLAREVLELHTLGVRNGYTQQDVTELARAITGNTVSGIAGNMAVRDLTANAPPGTFTFLNAIHEPGVRVILSKQYANTGEGQTKAILTDLAGHPATAAHLCTKLARHFAGDVPPSSMIERLKTAYLRSGGDLPSVYRAIVASPEAWTAMPTKFKTPWEWTVSAYRALGVRSVKPSSIVGLMNQLGQPIWKPGQPIGYDDLSEGWSGPDAVMRRVRAAERLAGRVPESDVLTLAKQLFPASLSSSTVQAIKQAESPAQALALLLVSPEIMRR